MTVLTHFLCVCLKFFNPLIIFGFVDFGHCSCISYFVWLGNVTTTLAIASEVTKLCYMCEMTLDSWLHYKCGDWKVLKPHCSPLNSKPWYWPRLCFPGAETLLSLSSLATFLFYSLPVVDWLPRPLVSLNYYPHFTLVWFLSLQAGICVMNVDSSQSFSETTRRKAFKRLPI